MKEFKSFYKEVAGNEGGKCRYNKRLDTYGSRSASHGHRVKRRSARNGESGPLKPCMLRASMWPSGFPPSCRNS